MTKLLRDREGKAIVYHWQQTHEIFDAEGNATGLEVVSEGAYVGTWADGDQWPTFFPAADLPRLEAQEAAERAQEEARKAERRKAA